MIERDALRSIRTPRPALRWSACCLVGLLGLAHAQAPVMPAPTAPSQASPAAPSGPRQPPQATRERNGIRLDFQNADIDAAARTLASLTQRQVVVDPRVKGTISLTSTRPLGHDEALQLFGAQLRLQGLVLLDRQGRYIIVPEADARLQPGAVWTEPSNASSPQLVTRVLRLEHESASNVVPVLRPLISPNNTITVGTTSNSLVITDYADNLQRLEHIVRALDVPRSGDIEVLRLEHTLASDLQPLLQRLLDMGPGSGAINPAGGAAPAPQLAGSGPKTVVMADVRANALIVHSAQPEQRQLVRQWLRQMDQPPSSSAQASGNIRVVYLKNADATKLAATLRAALSGEARGPASAGAGAFQPGAPNTGAAGSASTTGGQIQADPANNALVITAPEPQYRQLRAVIDMLDARRAQVFVESLIAEVSEEKAAEFGIQWQGPIGRAGDANIGLLGTNFGSGGANILALALGAAKGTVSPGQGLNVGVATRVNGTYVLGALGRFLQTNGDANVLSTPNLLTLDNEEAKIVIGQNVPFVTGQFTNTAASTGGVVNPFQTIERRDIGLTLRVKPQISDSGSIKLQIYQEDSRLDPASLNYTTGLITQKRSIESNVLVDDGAIVVLGGLLQDDTGQNQNQVPGLGNVPILGALFRSENRTRKKSNLMVFLRPVVVRDAASTEALSLGRYQDMRRLQETVQPVATPTLPVGGSAVLPDPAKTPKAAGGTAPAPAAKP